MSQDEYPPLITDGFRTLTLEQLRYMCVTAFPLSVTRPALMTSLEAAIDRIRAARLSGKMWIDGSFVTEKIDPSDVDVALLVDANIRASATPVIKAALDWLIAPATKATDGIDGFVLTVHPETSPMASLWHDEHDKFHRLFGTYRDNMRTKGIVVVNVRGAV